MTRDVDAEFDRQVGVLLAKGYPRLAGMSAAEFSSMTEPLRTPVGEALGSAAADQKPEVTRSRVPFVLVVSSRLVRSEQMLAMTTLAGGSRCGVLDRNHGETGLTPYLPLPVLAVPDRPVYALVTVERGEEFCGVRPADAVQTILTRGRTPLTIEEGIALVTQFPDVLEKNHCFMLAGSRRGDRRVPALWISDNAPKLGWCWNGNPHTWLGTASARRRTPAYPHDP